ncbi:MAG: hypothetical protein V4601_01865 [Pseudomonadota bacterium]
METRTTHSAVIFRHPFQLAGMDGMAPAGSYRLDMEEEKLDTLTFESWRQTAVILQVPRAGVTEYLPIDPQELRDALARDVAIQPQAPGLLVERNRRLRGVLRLRTQRT